VVAIPVVISITILIVITISAMVAVVSSIIPVIPVILAVISRPVMTVMPAMAVRPVVSIMLVGPIRPVVMWPIMVRFVVMRLIGLVWPFLLRLGLFRRRILFLWIGRSRRRGPVPVPSFRRG
jgi:hypothetical protein